MYPDAHIYLGKLFAGKYLKNTKWPVKMQLGIIITPLEYFIVYNFCEKNYQQGEDTFMILAN